MSWLENARIQKCPECGSDNIGQFDGIVAIDAEEYETEGGRYYCLSCGWLEELEKVAAEDDPNTSEIYRLILKEGKCCICEGPLKGSHLNFVQLNKYVDWKFPVWGNILVESSLKGGFKRGLGILCDNCVDPNTGSVKGDVKYALEVRDDNSFYYHETSDLKDAEPITEEMIRGL